MITLEKNSKIANKVAAGVAALGVFAGVGLATAPAQAQLTIQAGTFGISGDVTFTGDPTNPTLSFSPIGSSGQGQFLDATLINLLDLTLSGPNEGSLYDVPALANFVTIGRSPAQGGGTVTGNLEFRSNGIRRTPPFDVSPNNFSYVIADTPLDILFREPRGFLLPGTLSINASQSSFGAFTSGTFQITLGKPEGEVRPLPVPEPTTILGLGVMAALGMTTGLKRKKSFNA